MVSDSALLEVVEMELREGGATALSALIGGGVKVFTPGGAIWTRMEWSPHGSSLNVDRAWSNEREVTTSIDEATATPTNTK